MLYGKGKLPYDEEKDFAPITVSFASIRRCSVTPGCRGECEGAHCARPEQAGRAPGTAGWGHLHMNMVLLESMAGVVPSQSIIAGRRPRSPMSSPATSS
jgi:hypothetical protein